MTDEEAKALGERALATGLWLDKDGLWPDGALAGDGRRCLASTWYDGPWHTWWGGGPEVVCEREAPAGAWPDFRDDATRGCLLARARGAWGKRALAVVCFADPGEEYGEQWRVWSYASSLVHRGNIVSGTTEIEALVAVLKTAPRVQGKKP